MMKKKINQKGISLISLSIMVMVILAITGTIIYNVKNNLKVERLEQMQDDIENLQGKVDTYYAQYGKIPAKTDVEYTKITQMQDAGIISQAVDTGKFYVLDLSAIENLTLNFGQDYEIVKSLTSEVEINRYDNLYIINENSHNIFFPKGITVDEEVFYTNYRAEDVDTEAVNLRYVDNVKIPEGYHYISGNKAEGIIIQNDTTSEQYKWIVVEDELIVIPDGITVEDETEFLNNANLFGGYYQGVEDTTKVIYLPIEEKWSDTYDKTGKYVDKNEDTATIPAGFKVSQTPGMDTITTGLVVMAPDGSEFVWVPVDSSLRVAGIEGKEMAVLQEGSETNYQGVLYNFEGTGSTITSTKKNIEIIGGNSGHREPDNLIGSDGTTYAYDSEEMFTNQNAGTWTDTMYQKEYNEMIEKVIKYGGFYVGRYETSIYTTSTNEEVVASKRNVLPMSGELWFQHYYQQKQYASKNGLDEVVGSSMIWGSQYDAMLNWALQGPDKEKIQENTNGNHSGQALKTGITATDKINNIFDLEGNFAEWTLEAGSTDRRMRRGGSKFNEIETPSFRSAGYAVPTNSNQHTSSRITLYIK